MVVSRRKWKGNDGTDKLGRYSLAYLGGTISEKDIKIKKWKNKREKINEY